jgi:hypothetical protein
LHVMPAAVEVRLCVQQHRHSVIGRQH